MNDIILHRAFDLILNIFPLFHIFQELRIRRMANFYNPRLPHFHLALKMPPFFLKKREKYPPFPHSHHKKLWPKRPKREIPGFHPEKPEKGDLDFPEEKVQKSENNEEILSDLFQKNEFPALESAVGKNIENSIPKTKNVGSVKKEEE